MPDYTLGISCYFHDSAAALLKDGVPIAAVQEERFTRKRHDAAFPANAIHYCLDQASIDLPDLDLIAYYEDPELKYERILSSFQSAGPRGFRTFKRVFSDWVREKRDLRPLLECEFSKLGRGQAPAIVFGRHHRSHAASAFFPSPFESAAVLCVDGVGEFDTTSIWHGKGSALSHVNSIAYPHSLGLLYSVFTYYCGFKVDSGEYKLMGLAPYGEPSYASLIRDHLIDLKDDGSFALDMTYFEFLFGERMLGYRFEKLFGAPLRRPESNLTQRECDLAASVQKVTEEVMLGLTRAAVAATSERSIVLAGGVALNCVANGVIERSGIVDRVWVQPAAGDAGCALGAALDHSVPKHGRSHVQDKKDGMKGSLLGPEFSDQEIIDYLEKQGAPYRLLTNDELFTTIAKDLSKESVVGWFQGRMEFGPRALGARSILADARSEKMQRDLNLKIKFRESFRPFAPAVLVEDVQAYFDTESASPYMLVVNKVKEALLTPTNAPRQVGSINDVRSLLPAITHVDNSARIQTVNDVDNPMFYNLLKAFKVQTGCSVLVNTSFNVRGEPIVCTPSEAYVCFMRTNIDVLVLGNCRLIKEEQPEWSEDCDWREEIPLD